MARRKRQLDKPPGSFYARKGRLWWRGKLPGHDSYTAKGIKPPGQRYALKDTADNLQVAYGVVWDWWESAAAEAEGAAVPAATLAELAGQYQGHADIYYRRPDGTPTGEAKNISLALRPLISTFGHQPCDAITADQVKEIREQLIDDDLARSTINKRISKIKRFVHWATDEAKALPAGVWYEINAIAPLKLGRSRAREATKPTAVTREVVNATIPHMTRIPRDMVILQWLTGMRSTEVCIMRPCDIDRSGPAWVYRPEWHKTEHRGLMRIVPLGPLAQQVITPYLDRDGEAYCFSPAENKAEWIAAKRAKRKTKVQPSQLDRSKAEPKKTPGERYDKNTYRNTVVYGVAAANRAHARDEGPAVPHWSPHDIRRAFLTRVDKRYGIEIARASGGHASIESTEIYLERDLQAATKVAMEIG